MYPTLQYPRNSTKRPSTIELMSHGKQLTFKVYSDLEVGLNGISETVIPTGADEDVRTTTDVLRFGEEICIQDLHMAIDNRNQHQHQRNQLYGSSVSQAPTSGTE